MTGAAVEGAGLSDALGEHVEELEAAAESEDDQAVADACAVLAAMARGRSPPPGPSKRILRMVD